MKLFYRKYGEGKPLIILHGLFGSADNWNTLAKKYGEHFSTYVVDLRNHGQSPHSDEWNYTVMAHDIAELLETEQIPETTIMGHSMGGKVAMFFAGIFPHKASKIIISDIAPKEYPVHHDGIIDALQSLSLDQIESRKEADKLLQQKIPEFGVRQFLLKNLYWKDEQLTWRFNLEVIAKKIESVGEILPPNFLYTGPSMFVRGEKSDYILDEDMDAIKVQFPQTTFETIQGSGHWIHAEKPLEYFQTTQKFI